MPDIGIITEAPAWFLLLCLAGGLAYALILYYRETRSELPSKLRTALGILRFVSVSLIAFLLLSPFIRSTFQEREKPLVVMALDNSLSIKQGPDSLFYKEEFLMQMDELAGELEERYEVEKYLYAEEVTHLADQATYTGSADFSGKQTDMSAVFGHVSDLYTNRNLGAVILAGDGIYNRGINPLYEQRKLDVPVLAVALGDTSIRSDLVIANVRYNRMAFYENDFPVQVTLNAFMQDGQKADISIYKQGQQVAKESVLIKGNSFSSTVNFLLTARETGLQRYRVAVTPFPGEVNTVNNSREIFIDVLESRNRILILAAAPHPDITAVKDALSENINYEVEDLLLSDFSGLLEPYNLVILHQVPYQGHPGVNLRRELIDKRIPYLTIAGTRTDFHAWNAWQNGLELQVTQGSFEEALPAENNDFTLFSLSDPTMDVLTTMPPLVAPFGNYITSSGIHTLFHQKIGSVRTTRPLIAFASDGAYRWGYILGDGIWKWKLHNFARTQNHEAFNELIQKMVQYLAIREERGQFRVFHDNHFLENEEVKLEAEVYNDSYELITDPDVEIVIQDEEGNEYPFVFTRTPKEYVLNAGKFPPGRYTYRASVGTGGRNLQSTGQFFVEPVDVESLITVADHDLLMTLANRSGGTVVSNDATGKIATILNERDDIRPVIYEQKTFRELISLVALLAFILLLLFTEWFMRKRAGSY